MRKIGRIAALLLLLFSVIAPGWAQTSGTTRIPDVIYQKRDGYALTMDIFKPAKQNGAAVLWMVSGGWFSSHAGINPGVAEPFLKRGYTVFQVVHGSQPRFQLKDIIPDIQRAVRFVRANAKGYGIDPNRIGISGGSAGGHLSLMMGVTTLTGKPSAPDPVDRVSSTVQAVACFFPPTDMLNWGKAGVTPRDLDSLRPYWPAMGFDEKTPRSEVETLLKAESPIYAVTKEMPPTLIIHGDKDDLVPIQQAEIFIARLKALGVPHKLEARPGKGHGWPEMGQDLEVLADWFDQYLKAK
jgi:acetyl esterase/lipase